MTPEQIDNMRNVMITIVGPVALIMPDAEIVAFRDEIQRRADAAAVDTFYPDEIDDHFESRSKDDRQT